MSLGGATANRFDSPNNVIRYRRQVGNLQVGYHVNEAAIFVQDNWRIRNGLTLNYGLRWESQFNPTPQADNTTVVNRLRNVSFPIGVAFDPTIMPNDAREFMPRVGLAWSPGRRTVIRANAGIFYARTPMLVFAGPMNNFRSTPGDVSLEFPLQPPAGQTSLPCGLTVYSQLKSIGVDLNNYTLDKLPVLTSAQAQSIGTACGLSVNILRGAQLLSTASDYRNPRALQWAGGFEHEVKPGWTAGFDFSYANTVHLQRNHDLNLNPPTIRAADGRPVYGPRFLTDFAQIWIRESSARSLYRAFVFRTNINRARYQFNAFYTLSWNYSDDDNERSATFTDAQDQFNRVGEYSYSRLDRRHQFAMFGTYSMPWGFQLGGSARLFSAAPFNATAGSDLNADGDNATDRPYSAVGVTMPRNGFRNRPVYVTNLRVGRQFRITEKSKLQFSVDLFNAFDNDNVIFAGNNLIYGPGINVTTGAAAPIDSRFKLLRNADGSYNTVNSPGDPFQLQIGLKFVF
ncbi:MAG: hypothetical protein DMG07_02810 [Acidobacteria bacterium]|nr:MAG: hypothetical protein DMG07_02810 [Acidobacteriota bacterium]